MYIVLTLELLLTEATALHMKTRVSCLFVAVDVQELQQFVSEDLSNVSLNKLVTCTKKENQLHLVNCALSAAVIDVLPAAAKLTESMLFRSMFWKQTYTTLMQQHHNTPSVPLLMLDEVITKVWLPAEQKWRRLGTELLNRTVTLATLDRMLQLCGNDLSRMETELKIVDCHYIAAEKTDWCTMLMQQIREYTMLKMSRQGALILNECRHDLGLNGDFSELEMLCSEVLSFALKSIAMIECSEKTLSVL